MISSIRGRWPHDPTSLSHLIWKGTIVATAILTSVFSYLAAIAAQAPKCAGQDSVGGFRSGISDFLALPLLSLMCAGILIIVVKTETSRRYFAYDDREAFRLRSSRITVGMITVYFSLLCFLGIFGAMAWISIMRYHGIVQYCGPLSH